MKIHRFSLLGRNGVRADQHHHHHNPDSVWLYVWAQNGKKDLCWFVWIMRECMWFPSRFFFYFLPPICHSTLIEPLLTSTFFTNTKAQSCCVLRSKWSFFNALQCKLLQKWRTYALLEISLFSLDFLVEFFDSTIFEIMAIPRLIIIQRKLCQLQQTMKFLHMDYANEVEQWTFTT